METGWMGAGPDEQAPAMPTTTFLLANRADPGQGLPLGEVLARAAQASDRGGPEPEDPDDRYAGMVSRGYAPGQLQQLAQRLGDVSAELQAEREKLEKGIRRAEQVRQMHEAGRITAWDMMTMLDDLGDEGRVAQLQRQQANLQQQIEAANEAITPPQARPLDGVEAAAQRAHAAFVEHTRALMAAAEAGRPAPRERRPFVSRGGVAVRSEDCIHCIDQGVSDEMSFLLHADPELNCPPTPPGQAAEAEQAGYRSGQDGRVPMIYR